ncbi:MAG: phosphoglycerate kinase, partial [Pseudomonadota bacterium]
FAEDCIGDKVREQALALGPGECLLLENLRFHPGETANDLAFARQLSRLCRLYVNDAFSCAHRAHASIAAITDYGPSCAGLALMQELDALGKALEAPERPLVSIAGGAKISTKIAMLDHLLDRSDYLVVGGGLANTLLFARGYGIGRSLYEASLFQEAVRILKKAEQSHCRLILPEDLVVAENPGAAKADQIVDVKAIPDDMMALDLGPKSRSRIADLITQSRTMLWNGPLGLFERAPFAGATLELARMSRDQTAKGCLKVVAGGGDTLAALKAACIRHDEFHHVSTAGGAFLHWLEGKPMPGLLPLEMAEQGK